MWIRIHLTVFIPLSVGYWLLTPKRTFFRRKWLFPPKGYRKGLYDITIYSLWFLYWFYIFFFFFFFFFCFGFYGPFKNISLISSRSFIKGGRKPESNDEHNSIIEMWKCLKYRLALHPWMPEWCPETSLRPRDYGYRFIWKLRFLLLFFFFFFFCFFFFFFFGGGGGGRCFLFFVFFYGFKD